MGECAGDIILSFGGDLLPELQCSDGSALYLWDTDICVAFQKNFKTCPFAYNEGLDVFFLILCLFIRFCSELIPKTDISVSSAMSVRGRGNLL